MNIFSRYFSFFLILIFPAFSNAILHVGVGKADITPPIGTPSAGYADRKGRGMKGVHDSLLAISLFIDNGEKQIVLCSVDHLGFTYEMVEEITKQIHLMPHLDRCEVYIASSHTHSGGGAYFNVPIIGEALAGAYNADIRKFYVTQTIEAIKQSIQHVVPSKIGIGYGKAENLSQYRGTWPTDVNPVSDVTIIKVTQIDGTPVAVLFNYPIHPTVLNNQNDLFSADFVGYARDKIQSLIGDRVQPLFFNGAQGDILPIILNEKDRFAASEMIGQSLAKTVEEIWNRVEVSDSLLIQTEKKRYAFQPQTTPFGLTIPLDQYLSEMNLIVLNQFHAFITIPGELSTIYDQELKKIGKELGYKSVSIFGLTNDAHGYIISPESWRHKTYESRLSFAGENYGEISKNRAVSLLKDNAPH